MAPKNLPISADAAIASAPPHSTGVSRGPWCRSATTIGVVATDAPLTKAQCQRLAGAGHDGLARAIRPVHTMSDGDTLFALATGQAPALDFNVLCIMAAEAVARACVNAVRAAEGIKTDTFDLPSASDLIAAHA